MKRRKNFLPHRFVDILSFLLIAVALPAFVFFEFMFIVPAIHEPGGFFHTFTCIFAMFLVFNIIGNMVACMITDTSVDYDNIKEPSDAESSGWKQCKYCQKLAPPRSFHCRGCKTCILKRDHHCIFLGCCVGHKNQRFFMMFTLYLCLSSIYAFVYNSYYGWKLIVLAAYNQISPLNFFYLMVILMVMHVLNMLSIIFSLISITDQVPALFDGEVSYERKKGYNYDAGRRRNMEDILGKRMHIAWLSPLIKSELPCDGVNWSEIKKIESVQEYVTKAEEEIKNISPKKSM